MPLQLREVTSDDDFDEITSVECESFETPFIGTYILLRPNRGPGPIGEAGFQEFKERQIREHHDDPSSHWVKVVDTAIGKIVGAANWNIYETNPFEEPSPEPLQAYWWPEGEQRELASMLLRQLLDPRATTMNKPHLLLSICFVHPDHRRRGVGNLLLEWGTKKADEMRLEVFLESTDDGKYLYHRHGFAVMNEYLLGATVSNTSMEWKKLQEELRIPIRVHFMRRGVESKSEV